VFTSGAVKVGGTLPASPNITLKADGGIVANTDGLVYDATTKRLGIGTPAPSELLSVNSGGNSAIAIRTAGAILNAVVKFNADDANYAGIGLEHTALVMRCSNSSTPTERARITSTGDFLLGGTLPASPKITLKANGEGAFANNITINTTAVDGLISVTGATNSGLLAKGYFLGERTDAVGGPAGKKRFNLLNGINPVVSIDPATNIFNVAVLSVDPSFGASLPTFAVNAAGNINSRGAVARVYADNTAAKAGGLVDGDIYRTATGQLMIAF